MKRSVWVFGLVLVVSSAAAFMLTRQHAPPNAPTQPAGDSADNPMLVESPPPAVRETQIAAQPAARTVGDDAAVSLSSKRASPAPQPAATAGIDFMDAVEQLTSAQTTFQQKKMVWKQLREAGGLDRAITELEQRAARNPEAPEYSVAMGQAYLQKIAVASDPHDHAILGLKADQCFDTALELDPSNWEARFAKASALTYWPAELNKGAEIVERFQSLIQQQETMPAQPEFAQSYLLLGEQYQKAGHADEARQVWQRGAELFPANKKLQRKLTAQ